VNSLRKFWRLAGDERRDLLAAACLLAGIRLGLWLLPFRLLLRLVYRPARVEIPTSDMRSPRAVRAAWAIHIAGRYVPGARSCLPRALAAHLLLAQRDIPARLRVGVAPAENGRLAAHAWVEDSQGVLVGSLPDLARFVPLPFLEEAAR
jgi:hypothetical protein